VFFEIIITLDVRGRPRAYSSRPRARYNIFRRRKSEIRRVKAPRRLRVRVGVLLFCNASSPSPLAAHIYRSTFREQLRHRLQYEMYTPRTDVYIYIYIEVCIDGGVEVNGFAPRDGDTRANNGGQDER